MKSDKNILMKIHSKVILCKILGLLPERNLLILIKYNKIYKGNTGLNLDNYKNYYERIEIDIFPKEGIFGKILNLENSEISKNISIYFNNNKISTKKTDITENDAVKNIKIVLDNNIVTLSRLFLNCICLEKIKIKKCNNDKITDTSSMFEGCCNLKELDLTKFNTENISDMRHMFDGCTSLKKLDLSNYNTNNVKYISFMFSECESLEELNLSNFNTNNVTQRTFLFYKCLSLKKIVLPKNKKPAPFDEDNIYLWNLINNYII